MDYCKNYFVFSCEAEAFEIVADGIVGTFSDTYVVGQYVSIDDSFVNDGVYKITAVSATKLTLDATLTAENTGDTIYVFGLKVPNAFVTIVDNITTYNATSTKGVKSESQGNRSVSYGSAAGDGNSSWQSVFSGDLTPFMRMFSDKRTYYKQYNMNTKEWC